MADIKIKYDVPKPDDQACEYVGGGAGLSVGQRGTVSNAGVPLARRSLQASEALSAKKAALAICAALAPVLPGGHGGSADLKRRLQAAVLVQIQNDFLHPVGARVLTRGNAGNLFAFNLNRNGPLVTLLFGAGTTAGLRYNKSGGVVGFVVVVPAGLVATAGVVPAHGTPPAGPTHYQLVVGFGLADAGAGTGAAGNTPTVSPVEQLGVATASDMVFNFTFPHVPTAADLCVAAVGVNWLEADPARPGGYRPYFFDKYRTLFVKAIQ